ncbi:MAG: hypothetical protein AAF491_02055 [Verrucomicrobiota bacterium]
MLPEFLPVIRWIVGGLLLAVGSIPTIGNFLLLLSVMLRKNEERSSSFIPVLGGISLALGLFVLPVNWAWKWCWLGLIVDFGCAPLLISTGLHLILRKHSGFE